MSLSTSLPADAAAERIVRHFQATGFPGVTEALLVRIRPRTGDRLAVEAAFDLALERGEAPPIQAFFEIGLFGFFSAGRTLLEVKTAFTSDFGASLGFKLPKIYFDPAPVIVDDALATGTKYDAILKLADNRDTCAQAVLLNDPTSSFFEYLESHPDYDWQNITDALNAAAASLADEQGLL